LAQLAAAYLALIVTMAVLDGLWLGLIARGMYQRSIGHLLADQVNVAAAIAFYLLYTAGLLVMIVRPALDAGDWRSAALKGAFLGVFAYMTYDLTNLATLKGFPLHLAIVDMVWGGIITGAASAVAVLVAQRLAG